MKYQLLEPDLADSIGGTSASFDTEQPISFFASTSFIYTLAFVVIIVAASFRYAYAGTLRLPGSEEGIRKSKEEFRRVTYGLLGVLGLWLILATVNKDMLTGNVSLGALRLERVGTTTSASTVAVSNVQTVGSGGSNKTCSMNEAATINAISTGDVCGSSQCNALTGCNFRQYLNDLKAVAGNDTAKLKMLIVVMCKESKGVANRVGPINTNGKVDCGLMQVSKVRCTPDDFIPLNNIRQGASILFANADRTYPGTNASTRVFAMYNAGPVANTDSADCNSSKGFTQAIPKWACPINAGDMCAVKNYACGLSACLQDPSLNGL